MATLSLGQGKTGRRAVTHDLPLVPFIDFMVCLIAFLMVTAVYSQLSRLEATSLAPGGSVGPTAERPKELHVSTTDRGFELRWQQGATVVSRQIVPRKPVLLGNEQRYPDLTSAITAAWQADGQHRAPNDRRLDRAVLHVANDLPFSEVVAVLDALHAPRRDKSSAFEVAFAAN